jgi:hypothetical protein
VVNLAVGVVLLPLRSGLASCSSSGQLVGALSGEMTIHVTLETRPQTLTSLVLHILRRLRGFCRGCSYTSWRFIYYDVRCLVSASGTTAVASKIGGATFASVFAFDSSAVA